MNESLRCPRCGSGNAPSQKFCSNCGQALSPQGPPAAQSASPSSSTGGQPSDPASTTSVLAKAFRFVSRILDLAARLIPRIPFYRRLAPFLGLDELTSIRPGFTLGALGLAGLLGIYPSPLGHIDTTPFLYPIMALISSLNPALGMIGGVLFGIGDLAEKMLTNQVYYSGSANVFDYLGARLGYIISYSAVIVAGMLPGVLSRAFRLAARRLGTNGGALPPGAVGISAFKMDSRSLEIVAGVVGGLLGGGLSSALAIPLEIPAFMLRANPDISCYSLAVGNLTRGIAPTAIAGGAGGGVASIAGGGVSVSTPAPSAPASTPAGPAMVTDQKVVSGAEAIQRLTDAGLHDGDCVPIPDNWSSSPSNIKGVGYTKTRPHPTDPNKRCLDPDHTAITVDWTHPAGPTTTTSIQPGENIRDRITEIFKDPPRTIDTDEGTLVVSPENLPDHVAGIGHGTKTVTDPDTGEDVLVIRPDTPVIIDHWPQQPPPTVKPTPPPTQPPPTQPPPTPPPSTPPPPTPPPPTPPPPTQPPATPPPPAPTQPPPPPTQPPKTYVFGLTPLVSIDGGEVVVAALMCVKVRGIHGGSGEGYLVYKGVGTGGGPIPVSVWGPGSENQVTATVPMTVAQFEGGGAIGGIGGALGIGASANSIIFFCGPLPNVYWVPYGFGIGVSAGISATVGVWNFHRTATQALADVSNAISGGAIDKYIGQSNLAGYMSQIQSWILGP